MKSWWFILIVSIAFVTTFIYAQETLVADAVDSDVMDEVAIGDTGNIEDYSTDTDYETLGSEEDQKQNISSTASVENTSPFVDYLGEVLYKWDAKQEQIHLVKTMDALKNKDVIGIYFSASWCAPCRQFTPILAKFYTELLKNKKKFEIVWVSRDNSEDSFVNYYHKMPWLAVPIDNLDAVIQRIGEKFKMKGIPHFVILDGYDATVYSLDGRTLVMKDQYGLEYPYRPFSVLNFMPRSIRSIITTEMKKVKTTFLVFLKNVLASLIPQNLIKKVMALSKR